MMRSGPAHARAQTFFMAHAPRQGSPWPPQADVPKGLQPIKRPWPAWCAAQTPATVATVARAPAPTRSFPHSQ